MNQPTLPESPVDGHRIEWWQSDYRGLTHHALVYHVNTPWSAVGDGHGADLIHQWQCFDDGRFSGRNDGWNGLGDYPWARYFATRAEAVAARIKALDSATERLGRELAAVTAERATLVSEAPPPPCATCGGVRGRYEGEISGGAIPEWVPCTCVGGGE